MRRRHPDVDNGDIRTKVVYAREEGIGVTDLGDDFDAVLGEQTREPLADERRVIRDHDSHGNSARIVVPCPGRLSTASVASSASRRSRRPARPEPAVMRAPPGPSSATVTQSLRCRSSSRTDASGRRRVLDDVRQRLGDDEIRGELDRIRQSLPHRSVHAHRQRHPSRQRLDSSLETFVPQERRVDSSRELA